MHQGVLDKRLADGLGQPAATALAEWAAMSGRSYRYGGWLVNGMSTAKVAAVFERGNGGARKLILKHDVADGDHLDVAEFARHIMARNDAPDFAKRHLTATVNDPVRVGDGSWITFQEVAGGGLDSFRPLSALLAGVPGAVVSGVEPGGSVMCDRATFAGVCAAITRGLLVDWVDRIDLQPMSVVDLMKAHLLHRLAPGQALHQVAQDWPEKLVSLPGEVRRLPNPFALARNPELTPHAELQVLVGRAHGDMHSENIMVRVDPSVEGTDYYLIDLSRYMRKAPLTRDPVQLVLTIVDRTMGEFSDQQRNVLIDLLVGKARDHELLPRWLPDLVGQVREAQDAWVRPRGLAQEWQEQSLLSLAACALMFLGRRTTDPAHNLWYVRLAARAADAFLGGAGGDLVDRGGSATVDHDPCATPLPGQPVSETVARLCVNLPGLRTGARRANLSAELDALVARAKLGQDITAAYRELVRRVGGPDEDVRHGLRGFGGGRPVTGEVFACPLIAACGREAWRPASGARPACHIKGGTMTRHLR